jgi:hypothetical protein
LPSVTEPLDLVEPVARDDDAAAAAAEPVEEVDHVRAVLDDVVSSTRVRCVLISSSGCCSSGLAQAMSCSIRAPALARSTPTV